MLNLHVLVWAQHLFRNLMYSLREGIEGLSVVWDIFLIHGIGLQLHRPPRALNRSLKRARATFHLVEGS